MELHLEQQEFSAGHISISLPESIWKESNIQSGKLRGMQMSVRHIGTMYSTAVRLLKKCRNSRLQWTTKTACNPMQPPQQQMSNVKNLREGTQ